MALRFVGAHLLPPQEGATQAVEATREVEVQTYSARDLIELAKIADKIKRASTPSGEIGFDNALIIEASPFTNQPHISRGQDLATQAAVHREVLRVAGGMTKTGNSSVSLLAVPEPPGQAMRAFPDQIHSLSANLDFQKELENEVELSRKGRIYTLVTLRFLLVGGGAFTSFVVIQGLGWMGAVAALAAGSLSAAVMLNNSFFLRWLTLHGVTHLREHSHTSQLGRLKAPVETYTKWFSLELIFLTAIQMTLHTTALISGEPSTLSAQSATQLLTNTLAAAAAGTFAQGSWEALVGLLSQRFHRFAEAAQLELAQGSSVVRELLVKAKVRISNLTDLGSLSASVIVASLVIAKSVGLPTGMAIVSLGSLGLVSYLGVLYADTIKDLTRKTDGPVSMAPLRQVSLCKGVF